MISRSNSANDPMRFSDEHIPCAAEVESSLQLLTWATDELTADVVISGKVIAILFASTTGSDSDWIVKLIDVYPEKYSNDPDMSGYQLMIACDVFRGRYRSVPAHPSPLPANQPVTYVFGLPTVD